MIQAYASYFASYLLKNTKNMDKILNVILFGSVAKGEAGKNSDIDIFIEAKNKTKSFENEIDTLINQFYKTNEALLFKSKGIDNKINTIIGKLDDWKELKKSIESTGIVLYGKYIAKSFTGGRKYAILSWDKIGKNRGAFLNKIYGFNSEGKKYAGILEKFNGKKIGKSSIIIPIENKDEIIPLFKDYKVDARIIEVYI
jgi:predicted nucleotidyltransferase